MSVDGFIGVAVRVLAGALVLGAIGLIGYGLVWIGERGMLVLAFVAFVVMICWMVGNLVMGDDF